MGGRPLPHYRATIRHGRPQQYRMVDLEASTMAEALTRLAERFPAGAGDADLVELRVQSAAEDRRYAPE